MVQEIFMIYLAKRETGAIFGEKGSLCFALQLVYDLERGGAKTDADRQTDTLYICHLNGFGDFN